MHGIDVGDDPAVGDVATVDADVGAVVQSHRVGRIAGLQPVAVISRNAEVDDLAGVEHGLPRCAAVDSPAFAGSSAAAAADAFIVAGQRDGDVDVLLGR